MLRIYYKDEPVQSSTKINFHFHPLPTLISILGLALILFVIWPIFSYELSYNNPLTSSAQSQLLSPVVSAQQTPSTPEVIGSLDYTQPQNWFPQDKITKNSSNQIKNYHLSIPKLDISKAKVVIGGNDLNKSLIHYPNTAPPGQLGSGVIFGHSILPQFYNPQNYLSIFSLLPSLQPQDKVIIHYDNTDYTYSVTSKQEVFPDDLWVLKQKYQSVQIKLITCVPPGLKTRRLVVTAKLTSQQ